MFINQPKMSDRSSYGAGTFWIYKTERQNNPLSNYFNRNTNYVTGNQSLVKNAIKGTMKKDNPKKGITLNNIKSQIHVHIMVYINWHRLKNIHLCQNLTKLQHSKEKLSTFNFHNEIFVVVLCSLNLMVIIKHPGDYRYYSAWVWSSSAPPQ